MKRKERTDPRAKHGELLIKKIEASLASGSPIVPWRRNWDPAMNPRNIRGNMYRGGNLLMTLFAMQSEEYSSPFFLTFNQALEHGGIVKPGESGWPIIFWKWWTPGQKDDESQDEDEDTSNRRATAFGYTVFSLNQCRAFDEAVDRERIRDRKVGDAAKWDEFVANLKDKIEPKRKINSIRAAEKIHSAYSKAGGPKVVHGAAFKPCYNKATDTIQLPNKNSFHSAEEYALVRFHEETHSSGHKDRLNRKELQDMKSKGDHNYSREELTAEFGASMLASVCGIEQATMENTVSYLQGWLKSLKNDPTMLYAAAQDAQKATDHILGIKATYDKELKNEGKNLKAAS